MSTIAQALGKGSLFEFEGESYTIAPWTYDVQAEYEKYLIAQAYANLRAAKAELGPEYAEERAALRRDIDASVYEFGFPLVMQSLNSTRNVKHLLYLCLAYAHKDDSKAQKITKALVEKIAATPGKLAEAVDLMQEANRDPNLAPAGEPPAEKS